MIALLSREALSSALQKIYKDDGKWHDFRGTSVRGRGSVRAWAAEGTMLLGGHMRFFERSQRADRAPVVCTYPRDRSHRQRSCAPCVPGHRGARKGT